jgi:hypothetical protein
MSRKGVEKICILVLVSLLLFQTATPLYTQGDKGVSIAYVYSTTGVYTVGDDLEELVKKGRIPGYDTYTETNISLLWANLNKYSILLIDEDCIFDWNNPGPDYNRPVPVTVIGKSFYDHKEELKNWIFNGGRLFSCDQNDISHGVPVPEPWTDSGNVWWTWLPDELQVESNEFPSDYPTIGYGHYPENLVVVYDPWIFSTPNKIDITKVAKQECHGRFTKYPGYQALVRDKSDGDVLEIYRTYGKGIVVLTHLEYETADPYDVDYVENEIFGLMRKAVNLELYVEDADKMVLVNKAPGDLIDLVAQIKNEEKEDLNVDVTIQVPAEFELKVSFVRNSFTDINEVPVDSKDLGGGKYTVTTLVKSGEAKQVVWRFKIPDNFGTDIRVNVNGDVKVGGIFCDGDQATFNMVDNVASIIVTNRKLLFEKYGDSVIKGGTDEVLKLLRELYLISDWRTYSKASCIVYYVDHYSEDAKNWNQNVDYTDETTANRVANIIDDYIEKWAKKTNPKYLMIVGGDEIIPFYRVKDPTNDEAQYPYNSDDPVKNIIDHNYFPTDNIYADIDGRDWDRGKLEISVGRIVGSSAGDMEKSIKNGLLGPSSVSNNAVVASRSAGMVRDVEPDPPAHIISKLKAKNFNILNDDEKPSTIENEGWSKEDLIKAMQKGFRTFVFLDHGEYYEIYTPNGPLSADEMDDINANNCINSNRPLMVFHACRVGLVTDEGKDEKTGKKWDPEWDDCMVYALVHHGASAVVASTALAYTNGEPNQVNWGEKLVNDFYYELISESKTTKEFGSALKDAKANYDPGWPEWLWWWLDPKHRKTMMEYTLYGVPWARMDPEGTGQTSNNDIPSDVIVKISKPTYLSPGVYTRIIEINVTNYSVSKVNNFDLIKINGSELCFNDYKPVIPKAIAPVFLPIGSNITNIELLNNVSSLIGSYNVPSFISGIEMYGAPNGGYTNKTDVVGFYPSPIYAIDISPFGYYLKVKVYLALIQFNPQTKETILNKYVKLRVTYQTPASVTITDFSPDKIEYASGETINASVTVENVGSDNLTNLRANLSLRDPQGRIVASSEGLFDIASGESRTIYATLTPNVPHGIYLAELKILGSGVLASSSKYITINTGEIVNFTWISEVESGGLENFTISFRNGYQNTVEATGVVYIYDSDYIKVGEVYSAPVQIPANTTYDIKISWDTTGKDYGKYTASAVVLIENEQFGPERCSFEIKPRPAPVPPPPPPIVKPIIVPAPFNFTLEISPSSDAAQQGVSKQVKITVNLVSGLPELVSLRATGIPPNASVEFSNSSGYPTFMSIFTISTSESTPPGTYTIKIEAEGGLLKREAVYTLDVIPKIPPIQYFMGHLGNLSGRTLVYRKVIEGKTIEVLVDYRTIIDYEKTGYCGLENMPPAYSIDEQIKQWKAGYSKNRMYYGVDGCWYWVYFPATYRG